MRIINLAATASRSWPIAKNEKGTLELPNFLLNLDCQGLFSSLFRDLEFKDQTRRY